MIWYSDFCVGHPSRTTKKYDITMFYVEDKGAPYCKFHSLLSSFMANTKIHFQANSKGIMEHLYRTVTRSVSIMFGFQLDPASRTHFLPFWYISISPSQRRKYMLVLRSISFQSISLSDRFANSIYNWARQVHISLFMFHLRPPLHIWSSCDVWSITYKFTLYKKHQYFQH